MKLRRIHVKWVVSLYLLLAFCPGCLISNVFRLAFLLGNGFGAFLVGMSWTLVRYVLLTLGLLAVSRIV